MILDYRKDIDGLRAIAVLLVVLFHAGFAIPGGFIGVDIFFVISGFLIASLIQKQILNNKFTFTGFYLHRMRRILPALLFVMISCLLFNWFFIMPNEFSFFTRSGFYSILSLSNIFFWKDSKNYFAADNEQVQLLHTWSLSVEEQFYIFVPIFLIILFKFFYKTKWFNYILWSVLVVTFIISQYLSVKYESFAYYGLPARFFELFIGVTLALNYEKLPTFKSSKLNNILALLGILLLIIPAFLINKNSIFPGYNALFVCLGSAILIYLGKTEEKTIITKLLSIKPLVFIGLISYSLYLWHWPVFATFKIMNISFTNLEMIIVILILLIVSFLSWKFIEQPFRNKYKYKFTPTLIILFIIPAICFYILKMVSYRNEDFDKARFPDDKYFTIRTYTLTPGVVSKFCHNKIKHNKAFKGEDCIIGDKTKQPKVFIYGDSHANSIEGFLEVLLKNAELSADVSTNGSLIVLNGASKEDEVKKLAKMNIKNPEKVIDKAFKVVNDAITSENYNYIIISGYYHSELQIGGIESYSKIFSDQIKLITKHNSIPVIIKDVPVVPKNKFKCGVYKYLFNDNCDVDRNIALKHLGKLNYFYDYIYKHNPEVLFIDPTKVMCDDKVCKTFENNHVFYSDTNHITYLSSKYLGEKYLKEYGNPFKK